MSEPLRARGDRRHASVPTIVGLFMLALQFGTMVWGASALHSSVQELAVVLSDVRAVQREQQSEINAQGKSIAVLRDRSDGHK